MVKEEEKGNWYNYLFRDLCQLGRAKLSCCDRNKDIVRRRVWWVGKLCRCASFPHTACTTYPMSSDDAGR